MVISSKKELEEKWGEFPFYRRSGGLYRKKKVSSKRVLKGVPKAKRRLFYNGEKIVYNEGTRKCGLGTI